MESLSKYFKDMDEVKASVESMKTSLSPEDYELMLYLLDCWKTEVSLTLYYFMVRKSKLTGLSCP